MVAVVVPKQVASQLAEVCTDTRLVMSIVEDELLLPPPLPDGEVAVAEATEDRTALTSVTPVIAIVVVTDTW